ncbi:hypothetical protein JW824_04950 [bacterium]|nr:hypothetical protein [bacterium]RQV96893.1 MAG: hypothetical protein EH221_04305 [bacterium]
MRKNGVRSMLVLVMVLLVLVLADVSFSEEFCMSGDFTWVSTYIWRGIRQFEGNTLQGIISGNWKYLSFGVWYSSVSFGDGTLMETDPFLNLSFNKGSLSGGIGMTYYSYDFKKWNGYADHEIELAVNAGFSPVGISIYYIPKQASTKGDLKCSNYWIELSSASNTLDMHWGIIIGYGTYSSRYLEMPKKEAIGNVTLSAQKEVIDQLTVGWYYEIPFRTDLENSFWISCSLSYKIE